MDLFRDFSLKVGRGSRVPPQSLKKTPKWISREPTGSPRINKLSLKVPPSTKNTLHFPPRVAKWSPRCYNGAPGPPKVQEKHNAVPKSINQHENVQKSIRKHTQAHIDTNNQPTNQGNTERHESTQPNKHTRTHKSFELQTQTQTPAAGCSPKAT